MSSHSWLFAADVPASTEKSQALQRRTDEIAAEAFARVEKRRLAFEELKSTLSTPRDRILAWEKLHGLRLPFDPQHPILQSIARSTGLTLEQVREELASRNEKATGGARSPSVYG